MTVIFLSDIRRMWRAAVIPATPFPMITTFSEEDIILPV
jgi:hypothetical protein